MSLEFADKIRHIREQFYLTQQNFADLLGITHQTISGWENLREPLLIWERVIQFILDCPAAAVPFLNEKPWRDEPISWPSRVRAILKKLGWTQRMLAEFFSVHGTAIQKWLTEESDMDNGYKITLSLLELYSDVDPKQWPAAIYVAEADVITAERVKLLRQSLGMRQRDLANLIHMNLGSVSTWELGDERPRWCPNLLLRIVETFPRAATLMETIHWEDPVPPQKAKDIRLNLGMSHLELARLLGSTVTATFMYENGSQKLAGCAALTYRLLEQYPEEFIGFIKGLSSPGGQACPIW